MAGDDILWRRVNAMIDAARCEEDLREHRLEVLAARRFRVTGRSIPVSFADEERAAALAAISARAVLERVTTAYPRDVVLLKGPEVASYYPAIEMRGFWDIDLVVEDAEAVQRALLRAGFEAVGDPRLYAEIHHLQPLRPPGLLLTVEVHSRPKWCDGMSAPSAAELLAAARPAAVGVPHVLALPAEHHALVLAAHSWAHEPLGRLRDLVDIALVRAAANPQEIERLARAWRVERLWRTTCAVLEQLCTDDAPRPLVTRLWAQNLHAGRERTVLEHHLARWLSDFWVLPKTKATTRFPGNVLNDLRRAGPEPWRSKAQRTGLALRNARRARSLHECEVESGERRSS